MYACSISMTSAELWRLKYVCYLERLGEFVKRYRLATVRLSILISSFQRNRTVALHAIQIWAWRGV